jgi:hypothetical protein
MAIMIKKSLLKPGDILFYRPKAPIPGSWLITWFQNIVGKSPIRGRSYCHVAIIDSDTDYLLESRWPKSRRWKINWKKLDKAYHVELWRVKNTTKKEVDAVLAWAHEHLDEWYDLGLFVWGMFDVKHSEVCSTFVAKAWANAERVFKQFKRIGKVKEFLSPDEIAWHTEIIKRIV